MKSIYINILLFCLSMFPISMLANNDSLSLYDNHIWTPMIGLLLSCIIGVNVITFVVYGIDKLKAKKGKWRVPETTLLLLAIVGGSVGAWCGVKVWHHKTMHAKFKYGIPLIMAMQAGLLVCLMTKA